jgi:hypothetical protein
MDLSGGSGQLVLPQGNRVSSLQSGEPQHAGSTGDRTIWFRWTAPTTGAHRFWLSNSTMTGTVVVYAGSSITALTSVGSGGNSTSPGASFNAVAGTTYRIVVNGQTPQLEGTFNLNWAPAPPNDNWSAATPLVWTHGTHSGSSVAAGSEPGEPQPLGNANTNSIWFRWQPAASGTWIFDTRATGYNTLLAAYTGSAVNALTEVAFNNDISTIGGILQSEFALGATAGTTYWIRLSGNFNAAGDYTLAWRPSAPTLTSSSPGSAGSGAVVTLTGTNLGPASAVVVGGAAATFNAASTGVSLTFTVPAAASGSGVTVTTPGGSATWSAFTVTGLTFAAWQAQEFTPVELAAGVGVGPRDDFDNDGFRNLLEFAMGTSPKQAEPALAPRVSTTDPAAPGSLAVTFRRRAVLTGATVRVEFSGDLVTWTTSTDIVATVTGVSPGIDEVTIRDLQPLSAFPEPRRFVRITATAP